MVPPSGPIVFELVFAGALLELQAITKKGRMQMRRRTGYV
jgi:hypothetical protein